MYIEQITLKNEISNSYLTIEVKVSGIPENSIDLNDLPASKLKILAKVFWESYCRDKGIPIIENDFDNLIKEKYPEHFI
jgi:hypothetical protein